MQDCDPAQSLGPPRQAYGHVADLSFAEEEGGQHGYQPLDWCWKAVPGWGRALLPLWGCVFFLLWLMGLGSLAGGTYLIGELEVGRGLKGGRE